MFLNPHVYLTKIDCNALSDAEAETVSIALCDYGNFAAISTADGRVVVLDSGGRIIGKYISSDGSPFPKLAWKPGSTLLTCGNLNGLVACWAFDLNSVDIEDVVDSSSSVALYEHVHGNEISKLLWNSYTSDCHQRLLTIDLSGRCCIWKGDDITGLNPIMTYETHQEVIAAAFLWPIACEQADNVNNSFLIGLSDGSLCQAVESGEFKTIDAQSTLDPIDYIFTYENISRVIIVTRSLLFFQFQIGSHGVVLPFMKAKLSISQDVVTLKDVQDMSLTNAGQLLAITKGGDVKCWDLNNNENYHIDLGCGDHDVESSNVTSLLFDTRKEILVLGTEDGICHFLRYSDHKWLSISTFRPRQKSKVLSFYFGVSDDFNVLLTVDGFILLQESFFCSAHSGNIIASQISQSQVELYDNTEPEASVIIEANIDVKGVLVNSNSICIWSSSEVQIYQVDNGFKLFSEFSIQVEAMAIDGGSLFMIQGQLLLITDLKGVQRLSIRFSDSEGCPLFLDQTCNRLVLVTNTGFFKILDTSNKEPRIIKEHSLNSKGIEGNIPSLIVSMKCNTDCSMVSFLTKTENDEDTLQLFVFDTSGGALKLIDDLSEGGYSPVSHVWDPIEPKVLTIEVRSTQERYPKVAVIFLSKDLRCFRFDEIHLSNHSSILVGGILPLQFIIDNKPKTKRKLTTRKLPAFNMLTEDISPTVISALVDFHFYLLSDDLNKSYFCVQSINFPEVWEEFAHACVKKGRLDIAKKCLIKMGHINGLSNIKELVNTDEEKDIVLAEVSVQLGMFDEAESMYRKYKRIDLLANLLRQRGLWKEAFEPFVEASVQCQTLHFRYAKYLEVIDQKTSSNFHFDKASVPISMNLLQKEDMGTVEKEMLEKGDLKSLRTCASYLEVNGDITKARHYYLLAKDYLSLVRLLCSENDIIGASKLIDEHKSLTGAYHLARHLESIDEINGAIEYYVQSGMYNHVIRLSKAHGLDSNLFSLAIHQGQNQAQILECAYYFEVKGELERAARLYMRGGQRKRALEIVLHVSNTEKEFNIHEDLLILIEEIDLVSSPELGEKYCNFLFRYSNNEKALMILKKRGHSVKSLIDSCRQHNVTMTPQISDILLLNGDKSTADKGSIRAVAEFCLREGNYSLASKKYTQAGDRILAFKCLLKMGDMNNIIAYTRASRSNDILILAGNYFQTLDYFHDPLLKKYIVQFYSKAKAFEQLLSFLIGWANLESSEGEYDNALKVLNEASKYGVKIAYDETEVQGRIKEIEAFIQAQKFSNCEIAKSRQICTALLDGERWGSVHPGDCYALLVQLAPDSKNAFEVIETMLEQNIAPAEYIEVESVIEIYSSVGKVWQGIHDD